MKKICFPFVGDSIGGSHKSTILLINNLDQNLFEPIIVLHKKGRLSKFLDGQGIQYKFLKLKDLAGNNTSIFQIIKILIIIFPIITNFIKKNKIDLVHTNDLRCNLSWSLPSKILAKHVWHQRTLLSKSLFWFLIGFLTNYVICISSVVKKSYNSFGKVAKIYNPFLSKKYNKKQSKKILLKEVPKKKDGINIGLVSRLTKEKGVEEFFKLPNIFPNHNFFVVGDGKLKAKLPAKINYLGYQHPIEPIIAGFDLLIAPSMKEGFGRVLVESMIQGTQVIASKIPAHIEVTKNGKYAILVSKMRVKNIITAINNYHLDKKKISEAQVYASYNYNLNSHITQVEKIYKALLNLR